MGKQKVRIEYPNGIVFEPDAIPTGLSDDAKRIMDMFDNSIIIIEDYMETNEKYVDFYKLLISNMQYGCEHDEFRECPVYFKLYRDDTEVRWLPFNHFIFNMAMWYPAVHITNTTDIEVPISDDMIIRSDQMPAITMKKIGNYINHFYVKRYRQFVRSEELSRANGKTMFYLTRITRMFSDFIGISINVDLFMKLAKTIPGFDDLLHYHLDETKQPAEIEQEALDACAAHRALIMNHPKWNNLKAIMQDVKYAQLGEVQTVIALKPDENGKTIPIPINTNYITGDLSSFVRYYINNISGRKAAILNNEYMGSTGYFLIMVAIATTSVKLSKTVTDCNTVNPLSFEIKSKQHLVKIDGRRYRRRGEHQYHIINSDTDENLIGETVWMRSPTTCAAKDGVCRECYGDLFYVNKSLNSAGTFAAVETMNPVVQGILSAKHSQGTNSHMIKFQEGFDKFFQVTATDVVLNPEAEDLEEYSILIRNTDFMSADPDDDENDNLLAKFQNKKRKKKKKSDWDDDDDGSFEDTLDAPIDLIYYASKFYVVRNLGNSKRQQECYEFSDIDNKDLFFHTDLLNRMNSGSDDQGDYLYLSLDNIALEEFVCRVDVENNELTKPIKQIEKLIDNKQHLGCTSIDELVQKMCDLLIESKISAMSVHGEMIIYKLIRRADNLLKRPNFSRIVMQQDYEMLTIKTALKKDPSINTSLSTPYLRYQLITDQSTFDKTATSDFDPNFRLTLSDRANRPDYVQSV